MKKCKPGCKCHKILDAIVKDGLKYGIFVKTDIKKSVIEYQYADWITKGLLKRLAKKRK